MFAVLEGRGPWFEFPCVSSRIAEYIFSDTTFRGKNLTLEKPRKSFSI